MKNMFKLGFGQSEREIAVDDLPVDGQLPAWLSGTLLRNGPGTFHVGEQNYRHWFDGLAMLHRFSFSGGKVSYANKFLETKAYEEARQTGKIAYSEFATDPCRSLFSRVMSVFSPKITDSAKVSIARVADQYLALAETPIQVQFDPQTLRSVGVFQYEEKTVGQMTTVHPQFDRDSGDTYNLVTRFHRISHYNFYNLKESLHYRQRIASVPVNNPAYIHSFGMSPNYLILAEFPLVVNPLHLLLWLKPYIENFNWRPGRGTRLHLIDRNSGKVVRKVETDPFFAFHHVNAFEQDGAVIFDIDAYPDADIIQSYYLNRLSDPTLRLPHGNLRRYRIPLNDGPVSYETISDTCIELPRFDEERYTMRADYRYVYGVSLSQNQLTGFYNQIVKINLNDGKTAVWNEPDCYPGEPVFTGPPDRSAEDEGVVLSIVLDTRQGSSFLLVLDAASFGEIARVNIPHPILFGYHGAYFDGL